MCRFQALSKTHSYGLIILFVFISCVVGCESYDSKQAKIHKEAIQILTPVVAALKAYHADYGEYPNELDELVPTYLPQLPSLSTRMEGIWYKRRDYYYKSINTDNQSPREFYLLVSIDSGSNIQRDEQLCYYPIIWRESGHIDPQPTPRISLYRRPLALDDNWVRYRD